MGSSEIVNSGRFSGGRSSFSQTCSLLSQYLKEKGSFGDLSLGFTHNLENYKVAPTETMNLLPLIEVNSSSRNLNTPPPADETPKNSDGAGAAPMTIFYGGQVLVFNDFPAEKAKEIMALASKTSTNAQTNPKAAVAPAETASTMPKIFPSTFGLQDPPHHSAPRPPVDSDLPIARKNSLTRFLEKRKDRVVANAPYPVISKPSPAAAFKPVKTEARLGLAPQLHLQIQRH